MNTCFSIGTNRIFYKSINFGIGKTITAYLWSPSMVRGPLQTFTEVGEGLYYLDYAFPLAGRYPAIFYEDAVATTFYTFTISVAVDGVGTGPTPKPYTLTVDGLPCADALVIMSTDDLGINPIHAGRTNALGQITFYPDLPAGVTIYLWRYKTGVTFVNPDVEQI